MLEEKDVELLKELFVANKECQKTNDELVEKLSSASVRMAVIENQLKIITWLLYTVAGGIIAVLLNMLFGG